MVLRKLAPDEAEAQERQAEYDRSTVRYQPTYQAYRPGRDDDINRVDIGGVSVTESELRVYRLRLQGYTWPEIAQMCDYSTAKDALTAYKRVSEKFHAEMETINELRQLALDRLDAMLQNVWDRAQNGYLPAVDRVLKLEERRAKLLGIDAPVKNDNVNHNVTVEGVNLSKVFVDESSIDLVHGVMAHLSSISRGSSVDIDERSVSDGETSNLPSEDLDFGGDGEET